MVVKWELQNIDFKCKLKNKLQVNSSSDFFFRELKYGFEVKIQTPLLRDNIFPV